MEPRRIQDGTGGPVALPPLEDWEAAGARLRHFTRWGGVSRPPFEGLNLGAGVGDDPAAVAENRRRVAAAVGARRLVSARQVHGVELAVVGDDTAAEVDGVDGLLTDAAGVALMIRHADCQALVLFDPVRRAVANVHCGWRGSAAGLPGRAVAAMNAAFGSRPGDLLAAVGPALGPCCAEFRDWERLLPPGLHRFRVGARHVDFRAATRWQLEAAGVRPERITVCETCTACSRDFFSYRREGRTGRAATVVMLAGAVHGR
ncbi:peptidoglycan editing factor PgeF [Dissulfurirhabdus thermomarina]|uniref:Purine nucleoside phosphorylase n=1 Tax=Dissulfurirhabdus thermomarina TaxID=1765737 RepID=A0A6N9TR38_DISTH|nr:peptidoglycan editing factor PgeF [Dissulfurirhabdus thermomarina]NDY43538.1 peptidoglycan editing factor PgeF [Dissulfurirhabdus thermomarina]NMX23779.1 peptidoglycan editing factor PgeF [Dissulfurirhabdus thermomarina]